MAIASDSAFARPGDLDPTFNGNGIASTNIRNDASSSGATAIAIQTDGRIVVAGGDFVLVRYNTDGSLDPSFGEGGRVLGPVPQTLRGIALQLDGKIVAVGTRYSSDFAVVRFNADGSLDASFGLDGIVTTTFGPGNAEAMAVTIAVDGKIIAAGRAGGSFAVARYNPNGSLDASFDGDGTLTTAFAYGSEADAVTLQPDGKIVVAGYAGNGSNSDFAITRYLTDGTLDITFGGSGKVMTPISNSSDYAYALALQPDGRIVVAGRALMGGTFDAYDMAIVRYTTDGILDVDFDGDGIRTIPVGTYEDWATGVAVQDDGKIVAGGRSDGRFAVVRMNPHGDLDASFGNQGLVTTAIRDPAEFAVGHALALQADGKIVLAGECEAYLASRDFGVARYDANGTLDTSFDGDGTLTTAIGGSSDYATAIAVQPDGKIVVAGNANVQPSELDYDFAVARFNSDGTIDPSFGDSGRVSTPLGSDGVIDLVYAIAVQNDGKIIVGGMADGLNDTFGLIRYQPDGTLDTSFDGDGKVVGPQMGIASGVGGIALQADGKIVAVGGAFDGQQSAFAIVRYNSNGSLDNSFGTNGRVTTSIGASQLWAWSVAIQPDGKIVSAGGSRTTMGWTSTVAYVVMRHNADGSLDTSFGNAGTVVTPVGSNSGQAQGVALQPDGKIVVTGYSSIGSNQFATTMRHNADGSLDTSFDGDGKVTSPTATGYTYAVSLQSDGKIVVGGSKIIRYNANGSLDTSFGINGVSPAPGVTALAAQEDGKIVGASGTLGPGTDLDFAALRIITFSCGSSDGVVEDGEECDLGSSVNGTAGACCTAVCTEQYPCPVTATPTSTSTQTATPTTTESPTASATLTPTGTPTYSATETPSATPTSTSSATYTATATQTATETPTATATTTPSATPTSTASATQTSTPSPSPSETSTATPTQTATATETASTTPTATLIAGCPAQPLACDAATKNSIALKYDSIPRRSTFKWKWSAKDAGLTRFSFGDPVAGVTSYTLCLYDHAADASQLRMGLNIVAAPVCDGKPCWKGLGSSGWGYKDKHGTSGVLKASLKAIAGRTSTISVIGRYSELAIPPPQSGDALFAMSSTAVIQLYHSSSAQCWESRFMASEATRNVGYRFISRVP